MSYTMALFGTIIQSVIPFGDKLLTAATPKINKKDTANRVNVAKAMQKAIREGNLDESYSTAVHGMETRNREKLVANRLENGQYIYEQVGKMGPALNILVPGSGEVVGAVCHAGKTQHMCEYITQNNNLQKTVTQVAKFVLPVVGTALLAPVVAPLITTGLIVAGVTTVVGTALVADTVNYLKK